jgi:hypothetical protein
MGRRVPLAARRATSQSATSHEFLGKPQTTCPWSWRHGWRRASTIPSTRSGKTTSEEDNLLLANGSSDPHLQGHSSRLGTGQVTMNANNGDVQWKRWGPAVEAPVPAEHSWRAQFAG